MMTVIKSLRDEIKQLRNDKLITNKMVTDGDHGHHKTTSISRLASTTSSPTPAPSGTSTGTSGLINETILSVNRGLPQ
eukprot:2775968-Pyramimonas_sp.AAC.1